MLFLVVRGRRRRHRLGVLLDQVLWSNIRNLHCGRIRCPGRGTVGAGLRSGSLRPFCRSRGFAGQAVVIDALPRYYPRWMRWVLAVPGLRELVTWNLLVVMRKRADSPPSTQEVA